MTADVSQDRRVTVLNRGHKRPALTEGSRLCWALPSPVHERSGYRASRPTGYKVMRSFRIVVHGPVLASRRDCHRDPARCGRAIIAPSSSRSRPLTRRLRRWPSASLDRGCARRHSGSQVGTKKQLSDRTKKRKKIYPLVSRAKPRKPMFAGQDELMEPQDVGRPDEPRQTCSDS